MHSNEIMWAQVEKEALAICAACEKWDLWIYGKAITVHSDHQPLDTIFKNQTSEAHDEATVVYKKGTSLVIADTLSRAPLANTNEMKPTSFERFNLEMETSEFEPNPMLLPKTSSDLQVATSRDVGMVERTKVILPGWPMTKSKLPTAFMPFWGIRDQLSMLFINKFSYLRPCNTIFYRKLMHPVLELIVPYKCVRMLSMDASSSKRYLFQLWKMCLFCD